MEIIFRHIWVFFVATTFANAFKVKRRAKQYIEINPDLKDGYDRLFKNFLIYGNIPWVIMGIGDISGLTKSFFDVFKPWQLNPIVLAFHASIICLWILGSYWIYFNNGAEFLAKHPGFFNFGEPSRTNSLNKNKIRFFWGLGIISGTIAEVGIWQMGKSAVHIQQTTNPHQVYDFGDRLPGFGFMLIPLLFVAIGIGVYFYHKKFVDSSSTLTFGVNKRKKGMIFGIAFASIAGLMSLSIIPSMLSNYFKTKNVYDKKQYQTIKGEVANFHPMPEGGHDTERFDVNGIHFEYSDFVVGDYGYNNAASHGGAIKEGLKVKIGYFNNGNKNVILKLETE